MPELNITVKQADQIWQSPDGQRTIYELALESNGKLFKAKTYSKVIATPGWSGTVLADKRQGRDGEEVFVKQVPKEGGLPARQPRDDAAIKAQMAVKAAAHWVAATDPEASLGTVETVARELFVMVDRVKATKPTEEGKVPDQLYDGDGPLDLDKVNDIFG